MKHGARNAYAKEKTLKPRGAKRDPQKATRPLKNLHCRPNNRPTINIWMHLVAVLGRLAHILGHSWGVLAAYWGILWPPWGVVWPSWPPKTPRTTDQTTRCTDVRLTVLKATSSLRSLRSLRSPYHSQATGLHISLDVTNETLEMLAKTLQVLQEASRTPPRRSRRPQDPSKCLQNASKRPKRFQFWWKNGLQNQKNDFHDLFGCQFSWKNGPETQKNRSWRVSWGTLFALRHPLKNQ